MLRMSKLQGLGILDTTVGQANGIASLNAEGKIPRSQVPSVRSATDLLYSKEDAQSLTEWTATMTSDAMRDRGLVITASNADVQSSYASLAHVDSLWFAGSSTERLKYSTDGKVWLDVQSTLAIYVNSESLQIVCKWQDKYWCIARDGLYNSVDGIRWQRFVYNTAYNKGAAIYSYEEFLFFNDRYRTVQENYDQYWLELRGNSTVQGIVYYKGYIWGLLSFVNSAPAYLLWRFDPTTRQSTKFISVSSSAIRGYKLRVLNDKLFVCTDAGVYCTEDGETFINTLTSSAADIAFSRNRYITPSFWSTDLQTWHQSEQGSRSSWLANLEGVIIRGDISYGSQAGYTYDGSVWYPFSYMLGPILSIGTFAVGINVYSSPKRIVWTGKNI